MRGLTGTRPVSRTDRADAPRSPSGTALAGASAVCGVLLLATVAGCTSGDGVRVEQSAAASAGPQGKASPLPATTASDATASDPSPKASPDERDGPTPKPTESAKQESTHTAAPAVSPPGAQRKLNVISLLQTDPSVDHEVKKGLKPCAGYWPVDVAYGRLTGVNASDVIVNVTSCADGKGLGSYVYRETPSGRYVNVFTEEEVSVYAEIDKSSLRVYQQIYLDDDPICCPTGQDVVTYMWRGGKFSELDRVYKDYPKPTDQAEDGGEDRDDR